MLGKENSLNPYLQQNIRRRESWDEQFHSFPHSPSRNGLRQRLGPVVVLKVLFVSTVL